MFSHVEGNNPHMVDVGDKLVTSRTATARATVYLPLPIVSQLQQGGELHGPKGPIFQTAIIAGIQAAKRTWELIPMCHPIPMENCKISCRIISETEVEIDCTAKATHKTGVEMEALTGASVAALTLYDMAKALSHAIEIRSVVLVQKTGGKSDFSLGEKR
ncbi:MAG: cyclic pyranopterin monophosphate synthase MoaC [Spirochaetales bacterium]|nr:cyclic pyranopterin monophosphate synthase MoaC [Spirochaetales bacterium]